MDVMGFLDPVVDQRRQHRRGRPGAAEDAALGQSDRARQGPARAALIGAAFAAASSTSAVGSLSQVMPPPAQACTWLPSTATVRMLRPRSRWSGPTQPTAPMLTP